MSFFDRLTNWVQDHDTFFPFWKKSIFFVFLLSLISFFWLESKDLLNLESFGLLSFNFPLYFLILVFLGSSFLQFFLKKKGLADNWLSWVDYLLNYWLFVIFLFVLIFNYTNFIPPNMVVWGMGFLCLGYLFLKSFLFLYYFYVHWQIIESKKLSGRFIFFFLLIFFSSYSLWSSKRVADGDQARYLLVTHSLVYDRDLDLRNNFENKDYWKFLPQEDFELTDAGIPLEDGSVKPWHNIGLSILLIPGYFLGGKLGAQLEMSLLSAFLGFVLYRLGYFLSKNSRLSLIFSLLVMLSVPVFPFINLIYPEIPATLIVSFLVFWSFKREENYLFKSAVILSFLPWLNVRFLPLVILFIPFLTIPYFQKKKFREIGLFLLFIVSSLFLFFQMNQLIYDFPSVTGPYFSQARPRDYASMVSITYWLKVLFQGFMSVWDIEHGFIFYSPWYIFSLIGILFLVWDFIFYSRPNFFKDKDNLLFFWLLFPFLFLYPLSPGFGGLGTGWSPISRYMVVSMPLWLVFIFYLFERAPSIRGAFWLKFLSCYSLIFTIIFSFLPKLSYPRSISLFRIICQFLPVDFYRFLPQTYHQSLQNQLKVFPFVILSLIVAFWFVCRLRRKSNV